MALKQLPPNWDNMTQLERDTWWYQEVYKGDMPQLTLRAGITGAVVGAVVSLVNLYIGIQTGFAVGMGVTSAVLSFAIFGVLARVGIARQITILENNAVQSAATAAGYMTGIVTSSLPAYMMITNQVFPLWQAIIWASVLAIFGVLVAFPWKRRFINTAQYPFPEGNAAAVVMDGLHSDNPADRMKVTILGWGSLISAAWHVATQSSLAFITGGGTMLSWVPPIMGVQLQAWSINLFNDAALLGIGGIVGMRTALSWFLGAVINYLVLVPLLIHYGVLPSEDLNYNVIVAWSLWPGVGLVTMGSLYPLPGMIKSAIAGFNSKADHSDVLADVELPMSVFYVGIPIFGFLVVYLAHLMFGVSYIVGAGALVLIIPCSLIAINSTGLTSYTPSSALAKIAQVYGAVASPGTKGHNLATGMITAEVTANASNLLMDIRAGWRLGAKPREQAMAHVIGAIAGAVASTTAFYVMFRGDIKQFGSDKLPLPQAAVWKSLAEVLNDGLSAVPLSARWGLLVGALVGLLLEALNDRSKRLHNKPFPISSIGLSLGFIVKFFVASTVAMSAIAFWYGNRRGERDPDSWFGRVITADDGGVTLASSLIAGAGLAGIIVTIFFPS